MKLKPLTSPFFALWATKCEVSEDEGEGML
jgi:hypothetical protein